MQNRTLPHPLPPNKIVLILSIVSVVISIAFFVVVIVHQSQQCVETCWGSYYTDRNNLCCSDESYSDCISKYECGGDIMFTGCAAGFFLLSIVLLTFYKRKFTKYRMSLGLWTVPGKIHSYHVDTRHRNNHHKHHARGHSNIKQPLLQKKQPNNQQRLNRRFKQDRNEIQTEDLLTQERKSFLD